MSDETIEKTPEVKMKCWEVRVEDIFDLGTPALCEDLTFQVLATDMSKALERATEVMERLGTTYTIYSICELEDDD